MTANRHQLLRHTPFRRYQICVVVFLFLAAIAFSEPAEAELVLDIEPGAHHLGDGLGNEGIFFQRTFAFPIPPSNAFLQFDFVPPLGPNFESAPVVYINGTSPGSVQPFFPPLDTSNRLWRTNPDGSHDYNGGIHVSLPVTSLLAVGANTFAIANGRPDDDYYFSSVKITADCTQMLGQAVHSHVENGVTMKAEFSPPGLTLQAAAQECGYSHFNWFQLVLSRAHPIPGLTPPYFDPPYGKDIAGDPTDNLVFYWDEGAQFRPLYRLSDNEVPAGNPTQLNFIDTPRDDRIIAGQPGEATQFLTALAGVYPDGQFDLIAPFLWASDYNTVEGGITGRNADPTVYPGDGGITGLTTNIDLNSLPPDVRQFLAQSGAQNVIVPEPSGWIIAILAVTLLMVTRALLPILK